MTETTETTGAPKFPETLQQVRARLNKTGDQGIVINKCKECGFKIRGIHHEKGNHHRKIQIAKN